MHLNRKKLKLHTDYALEPYKGSDKHKYICRLHFFADNLL